MRTVNAIDAKSDAHRALICAFLANDGGKIKIQNSSDDIRATETCLSALEQGSTDLYCKESGSTFRFLLPIVAALGKEVRFHLEGRLAARPLSPLYEELLAHGVQCSAQGVSPFSVCGQLQAGDFHINGNISSQFISGLLFALPLLNNDSRLFIDGKLESAGYVEMTLHTLHAFRIEIEKTAYGFFIKGKQHYHSPNAYKIEGDWSNAAFFLCAGALLEDGICVQNLDIHSAQGDKEILSILRRFGANVDVKHNSVCVFKAPLHGIEIDGAQIPDLVPILSLLGAVAEGETVIRNAARLRLKESDRLESVASLLSALGANVEVLPDGLRILGGKALHGGDVISFGDHRIVMLAAIASLITNGKVNIHGADAVSKSYPDFFKDLELLSLSENIERN